MTLGFLGFSTVQSWIFNFMECPRPQFSKQINAAERKSRVKVMQLLEQQVDACIDI